MASLRGLTPARLRYLLALILLASVWLVMLRLGGGPVDQQVSRALYAGRNPALVAVARTFTALGEPTILVAGAFAVALALWASGRGRIAAAFVLVVLVGRLLTQAQKLWIARARPDLSPHLVVVETSSFPSGHSAGSMIFYLVLALALAGHGPWRRWVAAGAVLLSLLIGLSRVMLGVHWPSDVIGGWTFGMLWVLLTLPAAERLFSNDSRATRKQL